MTCLEAEETALSEMLHEWQLVLRQTTDTSAQWEASVQQMVTEESSLRARGLWRGGSRTLLRALGVHHSELYLCAGLAWLLRPDGWHGLGHSFLEQFLSAIGMRDDIFTSADLDSAEIVTEEARRDTRADLVVRLGGHTVLVEAKVFAGEQSRQCDRLAALWKDESPLLIFLTRSRQVPRTALMSADQWCPMAWRDVAQALNAAVEGHADPVAPGVLEYLETIDNYGGAND